MTNADLTYILGVLDRSGSMSNIREDTEGGWNAFIEEQKKVPGTVKVSLTQFDDSFDTVYTNKDIASVPKMELVPRGMTALYDGIGKASALTYTGKNVKHAFAAAANSTNMFRSTRAAGGSYGQSISAAAFTEDERTAATK